MIRPSKGCILFDWGDTLMRDFPEFSGPMKDWPRLEAIPQAGETLAILRPDWILALATSADVSNETDIREALNRVNLELWLDRIYCFKNTGILKTSPEFYPFILEDLGLMPAQAVMVGDHFEADILGANRCGMRAIWFNEHSRQNRENTLHRTVHDLGAIPPILKEWFH
jgi:putative hydrolase of the HAD superfamily